MIISWVTVLIALGGCLAYVLATNAKVQQLGLVAYGCGLLACCLQLAGRTIKLL